MLLLWCDSQMEVQLNQNPNTAVGLEAAHAMVLEVTAEEPHDTQKDDEEEAPLLGLKEEVVPFALHQHTLEWIERTALEEG